MQGWKLLFVHCFNLLAKLHTQRRWERRMGKIVARWYSENGNCLNLHCLKLDRQKIEWSKKEKFYVWRYYKWVTWMEPAFLFTMQCGDVAENYWALVIFCVFVKMAWTWAPSMTWALSGPCPNHARGVFREDFNICS